MTEEEICAYPVEKDGRWIGWIAARSYEEALAREGVGGDVLGGFNKEALEGMIRTIDEYEPDED